MLTLVQSIPVLLFIDTNHSKKCYYSLGIWRLYLILILPCKHFVRSCEVGGETCTYINIVEFIFNYKKLLFYQGRDMLD